MKKTRKAQASSESFSFASVSKMTDEDARKAIEALRWPKGPVCPRCQSQDVTPIKGQSKRVRAGLYRCQECRKDPKAPSDQFTVTVGTIFEDSHIPLSKWLMAISLMCASKKGISALQLQRQLELGSYRSAWHMAHRIRHALTNDPKGGLLKGTVEADETYVGGKPRFPGKRQMGRAGRGTRKAPVFAFLERDGRVRAFSPQKLGHGKLKAAMKANIDMKRSTLMTDEWSAYKIIGKKFKGGHKTVKHSAGEYARGDAHCNTAESFFALLKRGVHGSFHHVDRIHLGRYCDEFEFRWDHRGVTDAERTVAAIRRVEGRRLKYRDLAGKIHV